MDISPKDGGSGAEPSRPRLTFTGRVRAHFLAGILVTTPIGLTVYLLYLFVSLIDDQVKRFIPPEATRFIDNVATGILPIESVGEGWFFGLGVILAAGALVFIGAFASGFFGRLIVRTGEGILARMPVISNIYGAIKQILEAVIQSQHAAFREVVLIEYPRRGLRAIGFVTGESKGEVQGITESVVLNVFVPTTPNPTSGFLLFVPREEAVKLHMSVEDAIKLVVSGGIVAPPDRRPEVTAPELELPQPEDR